MITVSAEEMLAAAGLLGVQTLRPVLDLSLRHDTVETFTAARESAFDALRAAGLIDSYGDLTDDLVAALRILAQPEREVAARVHTTDGTHRVCVARRGARQAVAVRTGDVLRLSHGTADGSGAAAARPVLEALGRCAAADIVTVSAPVAEVRERLDAARASGDFARILAGRGIGEHDAVTFGLAMSGCHAHAEIVAYEYADGVTTRSRGAAAVYDTGHGRIVAGPALAPDGRVWSTFGPGTDHRVAEAISAAVATLPGGRWLS